MNELVLDFVYIFEVGFIQHFISQIINIFHSNRLIFFISKYNSVLEYVLVIPKILSSLCYALVPESRDRTVKNI